MANNKNHDRISSNIISNNHKLVYLSRRQEQANGNNNNNNHDFQLTANALSQEAKFKLIPSANASPDHQSPLSSSSLQSITTSDSETSIEVSASNGNGKTTTLQDDERSGLLINSNGNSNRNININTNTNNNNGNLKQSQEHKPTNGSQSKSPPILIKYNYYDYNGDRQEQINQDMNFNSNNNNNKIARQLSPTFKQNLDQIVRNSQQYLMSTNNNSYQPQPNSPNSPSPQRQMSPTNNNNSNQFNTMMLARRYKLSSYEQRCVRCRETVYQMDKVGPLKDFTFYHQSCFKCLKCGTKLTLKTYFNNQQSSVDQEVYCHRHCPKTPAGRLDNQSVGIRAALNAPKVFDVHQVLGQLVAGNGQLADEHQFNHSHHQAVNMSPVNVMIGANHLGNVNGGGQFILSPSNKHVGAADGTVNVANAPNVDSSALYIQHAVQQTKLQAIYKQSQVDKKISQFLNKRLEYLEPRQKMLEMRHREEEEQLFKQFEAKWRQEETSISEQVRQEWQLESNKLIEKYKRQLSNIHLNTTSNQVNEQRQIELMGDLRRRVEQCEDKLTSASALPGDQHQGRPDPDEQQMIELERMNLEKTMTIKLDKKKLTLKRKLKEFERQATAELVERQSREMLTLISMKLEEFKEEQKRKIGSELDQFEAIESLANRLGASLQLPNDDPSKPSHLHNKRTDSPSRQQLQSPPTPNKAPPPKAPKTSKMDLYNSEKPDEVFQEIDQLAINVAREDQQTFTDLVHHLTRNCLTDVEKVRAIFRWITVKNLNTMQFDDPTIKPDTPLGLLRGIKQGSESYHVLFKRLCSYAGLHCVVIKGYSKSAGYQPGVSFEGNRFRNSWNAVYVAGAWRFVQCNWGARHLVSVAVMQDNNNNNNNNNNSGSLAGHKVIKGNGVPVVGRSQQVRHEHQRRGQSPLPNLGRRGACNLSTQPAVEQPPTRLPVSRQHRHRDRNQHHQVNGSARKGESDGSCLSPSSPAYSSSSSSNLSSCSASSCPSPLSSCCPSPPHLKQQAQQQHQQADSLRYEYDDHYFLTDPDEFIYEFFPLSPEWQLLRSRPLSLQEFEQLPFVRSLFFKYGLYFPQADIRSVLHADSSGATTIKIGMPTHMVPSLIFHCNLKFFPTDLEQHNGISLKRFVMQSVELGTSNDAHGQVSVSNIVSFRVHLPENGAYILDIFANSTTPTQYITGEPMKFKSVCKFKIIAKNLKTVMIPLPDCASGEYGPMKATRLFGLIPITHENGLISCQNDKRFLEIQFRMTRPLLDFMASLHKNGHDERQLSKSIKIFVDGDIVFITIKFIEDGQYGLDIYTRDQAQQALELLSATGNNANQRGSQQTGEPKKQLLTHCCKYLINVRGVK